MKTLKNPPMGKHPIFGAHLKTWESYQNSGATEDEMRVVQIKSSLIFALNDASIEGCDRINWFFKRIQAMTKSTDPRDYAAAVECALFYSQQLWLKGLENLKDNKTKQIDADRPIFERAVDIRDAYYKSGSTQDEKKEVKTKESQIHSFVSSLTQTDHRIAWFFNRIQTMNQSTDPRDYAAAVEGALFYSQHQWIKSLKMFNQ